MAEARQKDDSLYSLAHRALPPIFQTPRWQLFSRRLAPFSIFRLLRGTLVYRIRLPRMTRRRVVRRIKTGDKVSLHARPSIN